MLNRPKSLLSRFSAGQNNAALFRPCVAVALDGAPSALTLKSLNTFRQWLPDKFVRFFSAGRNNSALFRPRAAKQRLWLDSRGRD
jgi:hypothetical protein